MITLINLLKNGLMQFLLVINAGAAALFIIIVVVASSMSDTFILNTTLFNSNATALLFVLAFITVILSFITISVFPVAAFVYNVTCGTIFVKLMLAMAKLEYYQVDQAYVTPWLNVTRIWSPSELSSAFKRKLIELDITDISPQAVNKASKLKNMNELNKFVDSYIASLKSASESIDYAWWIKAGLVVLGLAVLIGGALVIKDAVSGQQSWNNSAGTRMDKMENSINAIQSQHGDKITELSGVVTKHTELVTQVIERSQKMGQDVTQAINIAGKAVNEMRPLLNNSNGISIVLQVFGLDELSGAVPYERVKAAQESLKKYFEVSLMWSNELVNRAKIQGGFEHILPATYNPQGYFESVKANLSKALSSEEFNKFLERSKRK